MRRREFKPAKGLSPPTRGNRARPPARGKEHRSIPAHAGEPKRSSSRLKPLAVYPRPRGGTAVIVRITDEISGLSPPTRGNPGCR